MTDTTLSPSTPPQYIPPVIKDDVIAIPQRKKTTLLISAIVLAVTFNLFFLQQGSGAGIAIPIRVTLLLIAGYQIFGRAKLRNRRTTTLALLAWLYGAWFGIYTHTTLSLINTVLLISILVVWLFCLSSQKNWRTRDDISTLPRYISNLTSSFFMIPYLRQLWPASPTRHHDGSHSHTRRTNLIIICAIVPIILVVAGLLSAADPQFESLIANITNPLTQWRISRDTTGPHVWIGQSIRVIILSTLFALIAFWALYRDHSDRPSYLVRPMSIMLFILLYGGCTLILMMIAAHLQSGYTIGVIMLVWLALGIGIIASQTQASTAAGSALLAKIIKRSLISLLGLYTIFLAVQISHVFNQSPQLMVTLGYTSFASYLHHGVAELIVVCLINTILMISANHLTKKTTTRRLTTSLAIASLLIVICVNARLWLYISYYGLTFDRIIVQLMCLMLISYFGYISIRTWLSRTDNTILHPTYLGAGILIAVGRYTLLARSNVDYRVGWYNTTLLPDRTTTGDEARRTVDAKYLITLSDDAPLYRLNATYQHKKRIAQETNTNYDIDTIGLSLLHPNPNKRATPSWRTALHRNYNAARARALYQLELTKR